MPERAFFLVLTGTLRNLEFVLTNAVETEKKKTAIRRVEVIILLERMCWNQEESEESVLLEMKGERRCLQMRPSCN
jgi:hypothetical protein